MKGLSKIDQNTLKQRSTSKAYFCKRKTIRKTIFFLGICALGYVSFLQYNIYTNSHKEVPQNAEFMIILGARVKGTEPSLSLQYRIDAAAEYLLENQNTIVIASGGQGPGEDITEAEAIKKALIKKGINGKRIKTEANSTSTKENIRFSNELIEGDESNGLVVTNDYHIYRATKIAKDEQLTVTGLPAKTPRIAVPKSYIREYLALPKYYLLKFLP
jgi:uncharacterized SAM-binding protein YcdF (DUF218 family)